MVKAHESPVEQAALAKARCLIEAKAGRVQWIPSGDASGDASPVCLGTRKQVRA